MDVEIHVPCEFWSAFRGNGLREDGVDAGKRDASAVIGLIMLVIVGIYFK